MHSLDKPFYKSKKAIVTLIGILFALAYIAACYKKPELIALQGFAATVILSVIGHGAFQGWAEGRAAAQPQNRLEKGASPLVGEGALK